MKSNVGLNETIPFDVGEPVTNNESPDYIIFSKMCPRVQKLTGTDR